MAPPKARFSNLSPQASVLVVAAFVAATLGLGWFDGSDAVSANTRAIGNDRIVSWESLSDSSGDSCEVPAAAPQDGTSLNEASRADVAKRKPLRVVADPDFAFAGIAVDPVRNEVVMADENKSHLIVYDRLENTPATAARSEPKRELGGAKSFLEFVSSVYIDPASGDFYGINNDTMNWMPVFGRDARGNVAPKRALATPQGSFGIAVDEDARELFITDQDDHAVLVFDKEARNANPDPNRRTQRVELGGAPAPGDASSSPRRILQGTRTGLADPHGIALDPKRGELFVSNWGTSNERPSLEEAARSVGREDRKDFPVSRFHALPGSGKIRPPSITVYPKNARSDTPPLRIIRGPKTQLNWPTALAVHPDRGELFVANDSGDSVEVFRTDATGDVAPIRILKGRRSLIKNPTGVAIDLENNELWVANFGNHSATVYRIDAKGDVAPLRVIRSAPVTSPTPMISNAHTMAFDTKREQLLVAN
jgi:DNA-binding beta-propeller fold protein YncE